MKRYFIISTIKTLGEDNEYVTHVGMSRREWKHKLRGEGGGGGGALITTALVDREPLYFSRA